MTRETRDPAVFFLLHVPKCAGTTVEAHFRAALGAHFMIAPRWPSVLRNVIGNRYPFREDDPRLGALRVVSGHSLTRALARHLPGRRVEECVLIRDPLGHHLSHYNYRMRRCAEGWGPTPGGFTEWYAAQRRNPVSRFLLNRYFDQGIPALYRLSSRGRLGYLEERLADFLFVGAHTRAAEMIAGISAHLGVAGTTESRNVTRHPALQAGDLPPALVSRILTENAVDTRLFERWADRGWRAGAEARAPEPCAALPATDQHVHLLRDALSALHRRAATPLRPQAVRG